MSGGQATYYLSLAREDYYLEGGEPPGRWHGNGALALGLTGEVEPAVLYNLFAGLTPSGATPLVQLQAHEGKASHRPGWDLTFSAPKSVSVLWSQLGPESRARVQSAHFEAVSKALDYLELESAFSRRGAGGSEQEAARLVVATFEHSTSRALDPQLHTHALVMNIAVRADGSTGTLNSLPLFRSKMVAGVLYRLHLGALLEKELGIQCHRVRSWFEVRGVPEKLSEEFSKRREAIELQLIRSGREGAKASSIAAIETRDAKDSVSRARLFQDWSVIGKSHRWHEPQATALLASDIPKRNVSQILRQATGRALGSLTESQAHFTARDFVRAMAEQCQALGVRCEELLKSASQSLDDCPEIVRLGVRDGEVRYTTQAMVELEKSLFRNANALSKEDRLTVSQDVAVRALSNADSLSEEQMKAVWHVTAATGGLAVVSGMAGTGKTRSLQAARSIWEKEGREVRGIALAARAAKELQSGAGISSVTMAKLFSEFENGKPVLSRNTILVMDEAGMVSTPDMNKVAALCREHGSKLVLVGDERQLQPIGPGAPFKELGRRFGQAELQEIRRQNDPWARKAVRDVAEGRAAEALTEFAQRGLVNVLDSKEQAMQEMVGDWAKDALPPSKTLLLASTRADVARLNALAQEACANGQDASTQKVQIGGSDYHLGDRVMFTRRYATLGVVNGDRGTLRHFDSGRNAATVVLDSGEKVSFEPEAMEHLSLGYACTTHKAQGATSLRAYILAGGSMQDRELSYVQASRSRQQTTFYVTRAEAGDHLTQLAKQMTRSREKTMAQEISSIEPRIARSLGLGR